MLMEIYEYHCVSIRRTLQNDFSICPTGPLLAFFHGGGGQKKIFVFTRNFKPFREWGTFFCYRLREVLPSRKNPVFAPDSRYYKEIYYIKLYIVG